MHSKKIKRGLNIKNIKNQKYQSKEANVSGSTVKGLRAVGILYWFSFISRILPFNQFQKLLILNNFTEGCSECSSERDL